MMTSLSILTLVVRLFGFGLTFLLLYTLVIRWFQTRINAILILIISEMINVLLNLTKISEALLGLESFLPSVLNTNVYDSLLLSGLGLLHGGLYLLFIDYFEREHFSITRISLFVGFGASFFTGALIYLIMAGGSNQVATFPTDLFFLIVPFFLFLVGTICLRALHSMKKYALDVEQVKQLTYMQWAVVLFFFILTLSIAIPSMLVQANIITGSIAQIMWVFPSELALGIGNILMWLAYARSNRVAFLQPQRMYKLLILNSGGLPVFYYDFIDVEKEMDNMLISGGLTAISSLLKEAIGTSSSIKAISFQEKEVLITNFDNFGIILFVDRKSRYLTQAMAKFGKMFQEQFSQEIEEIVDMDVFTNAKFLVVKAFGLAQEKFSLVPWQSFS